MKKTLRILATLSILASSLLFAQPASAVDNPYSVSTGNGIVACLTNGQETGYFTIENNVVRSQTQCAGAATIPLGVTEIAESAFSNSYLTSVTIPDSVTNLGENAFREATLLTSASLGRIGEIRPGTFRDASALASITIPSSVAWIGAYAFYGTALTSIIIPDSVYSIGDGAFESVRAQSVIIGNGVITITDNSFINNPSLSSLTLGNRLRNIGSGNFSGPNLLTSLNLPDSVASLSYGTFSDLNISSYNYCGSFSSLSLDSWSIRVSGLAEKTRTCVSSTATVTSGETPNSQVATFSSGVTEALIPATAALPAVKLTFTTTAPSAVTVVPMALTSAPLTSTPFRVTDSSKIVDIRITTGTHDGSDVTVCLDGASTDSVWHYTGGQWVELGNRSYDSTTGQVCGVTTSFSPFTAAPANTNPSAPGSVVATATGKRSATISFTAPTSDGGSVITSYTVISTPGSITKILTQSVSGSFNVTGLQPGTSYTFSVTATNSVGTSASSTSNSIKTDALVPATLSTLTFTDDGSGTGGKLAWTGKNIDAVLYTGPAASYPGPFSFGAFSTSWNGAIRNLTPETDYTISIYAISVDGIGDSKSLTFKTGAKSEVVKNLNYWNTWLTANTFVPGEAASIGNLLSKFNLLETSPHRSYIKVPTSRVSKVEVTSLTPNSCSVVSATAKVDAGLVKALTSDKCTISYTVSGPSKAPATLVKDFVFKKVAN
jgi:hypothetical protein